MAKNNTERNYENSLKEGNENSISNSVGQHGIDKKINAMDSKHTKGSGVYAENDSNEPITEGLILIENAGSSNLGYMDYRSALLPFPSLKDKTLLSQNPIRLEVLPLKSKWNISMSGGVSSSVLDENSFLESLSSFNGNLETKPLKSTLLDFRIGKKIGKNLELTSGISSITYGEDMTYLDHFSVNSSSTYEFTEGGIWQVDSITIDSILTIDSVFVVIIDSIEIIMVDTTYTELDETINGIRKYSYLEIPLGLTYELNISNRSSILLAPEIALGILTKTEGAYLENELNLAENKSYLISGSFGLGYKFILNEKFDLVSMLRIRRPFGNLNEPDGIIRKYTSYGASLGLRYNF